LPLGVRRTPEWKNPEWEGGGGERPKTFPLCHSQRGNTKLGGPADVPHRKERGEAASRVKRRGHKSWGSPRRPIKKVPIHTITLIKGTNPN